MIKKIVRKTAKYIIAISSATIVAALNAWSEPAPNGAQTCTALTGTWTGSGNTWTATTSSGVGVTATLSAQAGGNFTGGTDVLNSVPAFSETSAQGAPSLSMVFFWDTTAEATTQSSVDGVSGNMVLTFDRPILNPIVHFDRVGGVDGTSSNSAYIEVVTPGASLTRLAGLTHFETETNRLFRTIGESSAGAESSAISSQGTAAGSVMVNGFHSEVNFELTGGGLEGAGGDGFEISVCGHESDFGDAPSRYGTRIVNQGPTHQITTGAASLFLGTGVDAETNATVSSGTASDDTDEGVTLPSFKQNVETLIPVSVVGNGYLQAWIDWDGNGTFNSNEAIAVDVVDGGLGDADGVVNSQISIAVTPPQSSTTALTFARFRWASTTGHGAKGGAPDGEVEDYSFTIEPSITHNCTTSSSATGSGYATSGTGGFRNAIWWFDWSCGGSVFQAGDIVNKTWSLPAGITVQAQVSNITQSIQSYNSGDWSGDIWPSMYGGINPVGLRNAIVGDDPRFDIEWSAIQNGSPISLDLILFEAEDLDGDEILSAVTDGANWEPIEYQGEVSAAFPMGGSQVIEVDPANGGPGTLLVLSEDIANLNVELTSNGITAVGMGFLLPIDIGDAPNSYGNGGGHYAQHTVSSAAIQPAAVTLAASLTYSALIPDAIVYMGVEKPDSDPSSLASADSTGDDALGSADEDGVTMPAISPSASLSFPVSVTGSGGYLQAWVDWNGDGDFLDAGEQIATNAQDGITGVNGRTDDSDATANTITISATAPETLVINQTSHVRFRWSTQLDLGLNDVAPDGEVEDYSFTVLGLNAELTGSKTISVFDPTNSGDVYALPGEDVIYTLNVANTGDGSVDTDTVLLIDRLPDEIEFFNGDIDTDGPNTYAGSDPVGFVDSSSGLTFTYNSDVGFSNQAQRPADFAACNYVPSAGYDSNVTHICFNPKGQMAAGDPDPSFAVSFRARIK
ncbi:GEVED domain-containing protein [Hirschia litorea]|uniref:GEVED domain-containing protein n=1 Tax=Hirschia litorea TaxID=1199156 RepID=A0ABW2INK4_9PROT